MMIVFAQEAADSTYLLWGFILLAIAIALIALELFVPSGGLIAAMAGISVIGSITAFFMYRIETGLLALALYMVLGPIAAWGVFKFWMHSPLASRMILGGVELPTDDESDPAGAAERARRERLAQLRELIGAEGATVTPLRPVGTVRIAGRRIDAMAESGTIDANTPVIVTDVYDNQIKVRPR
jgi:membrane-bound serine protease (ClpP class)